MSVEKLEKQIKENDLQNIYLFCGEEAFEKEQALNKMKKSMGELIQGINYIVIDENNIEHLVSEINTYPFGYEKKLIVVKCPKAEGRVKKDWITEDLIESLMGQIETNILVFLEDATLKTSKLGKVVEKKGLCIEFEKKRPAELAKWVASICAAYQVKISNVDANYMIELCGDEKQTLVNEIRKVIEYTGAGNTITRESIDHLCIKTSDILIFDLTDSMGKKEIKKALYYLEELIAQKEALQKIMIMLERHFRMLFLTKVVLQEKKDVAVELGLKPYPAKKYMEQCKNFDLEDLEKKIEEFAKLDFDSKTGKIDLKIGLERIICM